jgi:hypothetical protein
VKSVEALGICTTGGNVAYLAADDNRVKVVATIAAWLPQPSVTPMLYRGEAQVEKLRQQGREARRHYQQTGENQLIPAYNNTDKTASYLGPMEYYMDQARGGGVKEWKNVFSVMSWEKWLDFDPMSKAALITTPYLVIHSDGCALPNMARAFFDALRGEKELVWGDGYHFDYYDQPKQVTFAAGKAATFLRGHLNG